ncbi:hypothetical protein [Paenibacillus piri]|uniref:Uncharacterized protein n=1 Tax=Paenibacillus piri TaxID=2547395 RepID=A0A4R5K7Q8_9BACL|nr:hypothetical protein [Paenibacillus piri]TDF90524.1 hypothetical protein E1757_34005 [Paenibacillus piri]
MENESIGKKHPFQFAMMLAIFSALGPFTVDMYLSSLPQFGDLGISGEYSAIPFGVVIFATSVLSIIFYFMLVKKSEASSSPGISHSPSGGSYVGSSAGQGKRDAERQL